MPQEYPYRECKNCDGALCCKNMVIEELTGKPIPPDDCINKKQIEDELKQHYDKVK